MRKIPFALLFFAFPALLCAQSDDARKKNYNVDHSVAIEGYDPVSYFDSKPREGKEEFAYSYKGVSYLFASQANESRFKANPANYEPAYGGWCAYAMGETGEKVKIDPETYKIHDGKLYLFYNFWGNNTLKAWNKNEKDLKLKGDRNWEKFIR
jgi:YHS domain-containing protein